MRLAVGVEIEELVGDYLGDTVELPSPRLSIRMGGAVVIR
jgi:hypothetical protein